MAYRRVGFETGHIYHIYNRGVEKRMIFQDSSDYDRFLRTFDYYRFADQSISLSLVPKQTDVNESSNIRHGSPLVKFLAYCLMPNHFHFVVQQEKDGGISKFLKELSNSYTRSFNTRWERVGPLFQGSFKAVRVASDEQLIHLIRYIHLNPGVARLTDSCETYPWSSYREYLNPLLNSLCEKDLILTQFSSLEEFKKFNTNHLDYIGTLEVIRKLVFEN